MTTLPAGAWAYLAPQDTLTALLGSDTVSDVWLFQEKIQATVEGSGTCAVVLRVSGSWATPNTYNTARFPTLACDIYADPQRDSAQNLVTDDTADKIDKVFRALNGALHLTSLGDYRWGDLRVLGSHSVGEPLYYPVPDGDHMRMATASYNVMLG